MLNSITLFSVCSIFAGSAYALSVPFRRAAPHSTTINFASKSSPDISAKFQFKHKNEGDNAAIYVGTIMVANQPFEVQLDTGSSDLWLDTEGVDMKDFATTNVAGSIAYADETLAEGPIMLGTVGFGDFVVPNQAFISAPKSNATSNGDKGLLGLGPPLLSTVNGSLSSTKHNGRSFLDNVFAIHPNEPNFITFALSRSSRGVTDGGIFTIAEVPQEFAQIEKTTPLLIDPSTNEWIAPLDAVIVNGKRLTGHSFRGIDQKPRALLDTGSSLVAAPPFFVDAMYSSIPGAKLDEESGLYLVPCDAKVEMTFVFGDAAFPVHPIDATFVTAGDNGEAVCAGAFTYLEESGALDFLLGDSFLRNVFSLYDFGTWTSVADSVPFMKLLSVTDASKANAEFDAMNKARVQRFESQQRNVDAGSGEAIAPDGNLSTDDDDLSDDEEGVSANEDDIDSDDDSAEENNTPADDSDDIADDDDTSAGQDDISASETNDEPEA